MRSPLKQMMSSWGSVVKMKTIGAALGFCTLVFQVATVAQTTENDRYVISISSINASHIQINATVHIDDGRLITGTGGAYEWNHGWFDFVSDIDATDLAGNTIALALKGTSFGSYLELSNDGELFIGVANVTYKVDLVYAHTEWDFGNEQAGRVYGGGLYSVTKPLFLT
ncbi:MAG: hypothetical protein JKY60_15895, partial [Kordiimonadaceae bacterium]|nr:hypothetical protein [Kordiimonadaceae bacterium]